MKGWRIFKDVTDDGPIYTVYHDTKCIGAYLEDDYMIKHLELAGVEIDEGLDCRSNFAGEGGFIEIRN